MAKSVDIGPDVGISATSRDSGTSASSVRSFFLAWGLTQELKREATTSAAPALSSPAGGVVSE